MRTQGGGGSVAKCGRPQIQIFTEILEVKIVSYVLKSTFDSTTYHLNLSPMFLNCLLLDLTVIELMSIVRMDKIWVEIAKNFEMRTSGGRGGLQ